MANDLCWHAVLTWKGEDPLPEAAHREMRAFLRRLSSAAFDGRVFPYVYVLGRGEQTGRLHVHILLPKTFAGHFSASWNAGGVKLRRAKSVQDRRKKARYLAHHYDDYRQPGQRRYRAPHGIAPKPERLAVVEGQRQAVEVLRTAMGMDPTEVQQVSGYGCPPGLVVRWDDEPNLV